MALDASLEGRFKLGTQAFFSSPAYHKDFDYEAQLRLGIIGKAWSGESGRVDYVLSADATQADGPAVQSNIRKETDIDFFRAWLRWDGGRYKIRGGRQKILFGPGRIFRPLGFFDTRDVTGVVPETRGVDGLRSTYFFENDSFAQGWLVPGKINDRVIAGLRWEGLWQGLELGAVAQYHPETDLTGLPQFATEMVQLGYHFKGEYEIGYWSEGRVDIEQTQPGQPARFDGVAGVDYTFNVGEGLHVLAEYFLSAEEKGFPDERTDRTVQQIGVSLDQPIGIDKTWQIFFIYDMTDATFQAVPQLEISLVEDLYLYLHGRWGGKAEAGPKKGRLFRKTGLFNGTESLIGLALVGYF
ncbi:MAG: hypothetical protein G3M78_12720 [Candidatus Nitrohelix vancouverensis]|uniref:Porin n=1 Tax=Candidatus Nitrohelix vancouverensis TaxID=2705534 RepID=A0A7T0C481_9BACT|nr:MAG: hypothetical protein G3M78_12720 [Candidatus Nitrohelix vancouverensis]